MKMCGKKRWLGLLPKKKHNVWGFRGASRMYSQFQKGSDAEGKGVWGRAFLKSEGPHRKKGWEAGDVGSHMKGATGGTFWGEEKTSENRQLKNTT